jgi:asparagine synthase (glutamine-hydrolysing)
VVFGSLVPTEVGHTSGSVGDFATSPFWGGAEVFTEAEKRQLISRNMYSRLGNLTSWTVLQPIRERFEEKAWEKSDLHWMTYLDLNLRLPELLLMRVDKMTMGVSLEGRVPFLDHKFVELALSIPTSVKTKHGTLKHILKKAVRGLIPDELIDRKKQGFGVPIYEWSYQELGAYARLRLEEFTQETDFLDAAGVRRLLSPANASRRNSFRVWCLLNFVLWWEKYIAEKAAGTLRGWDSMNMGNNLRDESWIRA